MKSRRHLQEEKFAAFAEKHKKKLIRGVFKIVGGDLDLAEDAYQEGLLSWLKYGVYDKDGKDFNQYTEAERYRALQLAIRQRAIDLVKARRGYDVDVDTVPFIEQRYRDNSLSIKTGMVKGIERLTPKQREAIRLVFEEGLGKSEAARRLGINESKVRSRLDRAFKKLNIPIERRKYVKGGTR